MAGGGLMQLVAYGAQDLYLTGDPQITFFKIIYRRHTNFAMECIEQTFQGTPDFNRSAVCVVSRNGDLIHRTHLKVTLPSITAPSPASVIGWVREVGHFLIKTVEIQIGGQTIDKHWGEWLSIWTALTLPSTKDYGYAKMVGENIQDYADEDTLDSVMTDASDTTTTIAEKTLYVPLQFWFNRNPGLALPLIALQFHEVKFKFEFRAARDLYRGSAATNTLTLGTTSLWIDYIHLDTDERRRFAKQSHEYLIEQLQFNGDESVSSTTSVKPKLNFNHPCKALVWVFQNSNNVSSSNQTGDAGGDGDKYDLRNWSSSTTLTSGVNPVSLAKVRLNGSDRYQEQTGDYHDLVQPYYHWPRIPGGQGVGSAYTTSRGINTYSFALHPDKHQPSGTLNWSRIDNASLEITLSTSSSGTLKIFVVNYNVLRITAGMGGLAYAS